MRVLVIKTEVAEHRPILHMSTGQRVKTVLYTKDNMATRAFNGYCHELTAYSNNPVEVDQYYNKRYREIIFRDAFTHGSTTIAVYSIDDTLDHLGLFVKPEDRAARKVKVILKKLTPDAQETGWPILLDHVTSEEAEANGWCVNESWLGFVDETEVRHIADNRQEYNALMREQRRHHD